VIEHVEAVKNLEEILTTDGVDGFIVGPYDLSASLGRPGDFGNPAHAAAIERIRTVSQALRRPGGLHVVEPTPDQVRKYLAEGFKFLAYSIDQRMLDVAARSGLAACRATLPPKS